MPTTPLTRMNNTRDLVLKLGIGSFNAPMVQQWMFTQPATTDPKAPGVILMVRALQAKLGQMGAPIMNTGYLDKPTAAVLEQLIGYGWLNRPWSEVVGAVIAAREQRLDLSKTVPAQKPIEQYTVSQMPPQGMAGVFDFLPDVPGGLLTYAVGGYFLYRHLTKR